METSETRALVTKVYEAAARRDLETTLSMFDDNIILTQAAGLPYAGRWEGKESVKAALMRQFQISQSRGVLVKAIIADGDHAVGLIVSRGIDAKGNEYEMPVAEIFHVRDGKVIELRPFYFDTANMPDLRKIA